MTKKQAEKKGRALLRLMKGEGWKLDVWENLGWHYAVKSRNISVHQDKDDGTFYCYLGESGGLGIWHTGKHFTDPNDAVSEQVKDAVTEIERLLNIVANGATPHGKPVRITIPPIFAVASPLPSPAADQQEEEGR
jgi:hypothetical protein